MYTRFSENISNNHDLIQWQASEGGEGEHLGLGIQRVFYAYAHYYCTLMLLNGTCEISMHTHLTHPGVELSPVSVFDSGEINVARFLPTLTSKIRIATNGFGRN